MTCSSCSSIDGLWPDWRSRKISVTESKRISILPSDAGCPLYAPLIVNITHYRAPTAIADPIHYPRQPIENRGHQKMKIVAVTVCSAVIT